MPKFFSALLAILAFGVACGGSDAPADVDGREPTADKTEPAGEPSATLDGPLVFLSAVGIFAVERSSGEASQVAFVDDLTPAIEIRPRITRDDAYALTFTGIEGESFSNDVFVSRISRAGGGAGTVANVGSDRESDDDPTLTEFPEFHIAAGSVWVVTNEFGDSLSTLTGYDLNSGDPVGSVARDFTSGYVSDGERLYVYAPEGILAFDPASLTFEVLVEGGLDLTTLLAAGADLLALSFDGSMGPAVSFGEPLFFLTKPNEPGRPEDGALVVGGDHLWMSYKSGLGTDQSLAYKGILGFNLLTGIFDVAVETHSYDGYPGATLSTPDELFWADGSLFLIDTDNNDVILVVDIDTGTSRLDYSPCPAEQDCDVLWNESDPGVPWIEVTRWTDEGDGSRTGEFFLERLDAVTGSMVAQYPFSGFLGLD